MTTPRFASLAIGLSLVACQSAQRPAEQEASQPPSERPNIIFILVDDLRWDEFGAAGHPFLETPNIDRLAQEGAMFTNAFHAVPLCSPNRATILTGQYPSRHGIIDNVSRSLASHQLQTFPVALQQAGYETGYLGKWHMGNDPTPRPGFDYWAAIPGQGRSTDPELYENGETHTIRGYLTDILTERAVAFIERPREKPFFLYIGHKAIHPDIQQLDDGSTDPDSSLGYVPAPRHRGRYESKVFPRRENTIASLDDLSGKPAVRRALERKREMVPNFALGPDEELIRRREEMILAVDDGLGRMMEALDRQGSLNRTAIIFTSDNGFWYGEHGLSEERRLPYEEGIRMPVLVRYPQVARPGSRVEQLVSSVDFAPSVLEMAQAPIGGHIQGRSFVPTFSGAQKDWRNAVLIEFYTYENPFPWLVDMDYRAVRTERYKYIHWIQHPDEAELYDLETDPFEKKNLIDDPSAAKVRSEMRQLLSREVLRATGIANSDGHAP
jgi:N-acetylglucosamine-6-sulfatase